MALLQFGHQLFDASLVVFDKDGTLIDFESMWGRLAVVWVEQLTADSRDEALQEELYRTFGYNPQQQRTKPESPLAVAATGQLQTIAASVLYRHGITWSEAEERAHQAFQIGDRLPLADLVRPAGDVSGLLKQLQEVDVRVAVVTTDHRSETEETLSIMGIANLVDHLVCGDDGFPIKPAPDMLQAACQQLGVKAVHTAVVGDTMGDLLMARQAGAGLTVAVLSGAGDPAQLCRQADVVLPSIDGIGVAGSAYATRRNL